MRQAAGLGVHPELLLLLCVCLPSVAPLRPGRGEARAPDSRVRERDGARHPSLKEEGLGAESPAPLEDGRRLETGLQSQEAGEKDG